MEFKVRTSQLNKASSEISSTSKDIRRVKSSIESVISKLDVGTSTGDIKSNLKKNCDNLSYLDAAVSGMRRNLQSIAVQYERTEAAIKSQAGSVVSPDIVDKVVKAIQGINAAIIGTIRRGNNRGNKKGGDPVNLDTGNYIYEKKDLVIGGADEFSFCRFYNSIGGQEGALGRGWIHNYELRLTAGIDTVTVILEDGKEELFSKEGRGYFAIGGSSASLVKEDEKFIYTTLDEVTYIFDGTGKLLRREDANGNGWSLDYDDDRLSRVSRDGGEFFAFEYLDDRLSSVTDHTGRKSEYEYSNGRLASVSTEGQTVTYEYDGAGRLISITNPRGIRIITNEYDEQGRTMRQTFPDDSFVSFRYDDSEGYTTMTEKNGSESYHFHDELFRNTENVYTNGSESVRFNEMDQPVLLRDRNGNETHLTYDNRGNITRVSNPDGNVVTITYEKHNKPVTITVNGVRRRKNVYDDKGNLLETSDGLGRKTSYKYNSSGFITEIRRPGGQTVELTYDSRNNITSVTDENDAVSVYEYDELNRVTKKTDGRGNTVSYEYDTHNNMIREINAAGAVRTLVYNEINKVTEGTDFNGAKTLISYNRLGMPDKVIDPLGRTSGIDYDVMWNESRHHLPNGGVRLMEYDENNNLIKSTDALGNVTQYEYDGNGNVTAVTDPEGNVTTMSYDEDDNLLTVTDGEGNTTSYTYKNGNRVHVTYANGGTLDMEYDEADQLVREINALGESREYMYTPDGDISRIFDESGRMTAYEYAYPGHPSRISYPDGHEEHYTYDANGNILTLSNEQGYTVSYVYDALDRVIEERDSNGGVTTYSYDAVDNVISRTDAEGNTTHYDYSLTGMLCGVTDAAGNRTEYTYDDLDMITSVTQYGDGEAHTTRYVRDLEGQVKQIIDPLGSSELFKYNCRGELAEKTDADGYLTKYGYNANGKMTYLAYNDGREAMMSYDPLGRITSIHDWTGTTAFENDILGRVTGVTYPDGRTAGYTYGSLGERREVRYPDGRTVSYGYDDALNLVSLVEGDTDIRYSYDKYGQLIGKTSANGAETEFSYDDKGLLTEIRNLSSGTVLDSYSFAYDLRGNKISAQRYRKDVPDDSGHFEYEYDALGRLVSVNRDGSLSSRYTYDAFGNRTVLEETGGRTVYSYNALNQLVRTEGPDGQLETFSYDRRGNLTERRQNDSIQYSYAYGAMNRMEKAHGINGKSAYEYNGLGQRVSENVVPVSGAEKKIRYTLDLTGNYNNLLERDVNGCADIFLWDTAIAAMKSAVNDGYYYAADDKGSPVRMYDAAGNTIASCGYSEFGNQIGGAGKMSELQPFGYIGYRNDTVAGTYFAQAREFLPEYGRFAAEDRVRGVVACPISENRYIYCRDNPVGLMDMNGKFPVMGIIGYNVGRYVGRRAIDWIKDKHYRRNEILQNEYENLSYEEEQELINTIRSGDDGWRKLSPDKSIYHTNRNTDQEHSGDDYTSTAADNEKYVRKIDGGKSQEIVIGKKHYKDGRVEYYVVRNSGNRGTANYADADGLIGTAKHVLLDMVPYWLWGNDENDTTKRINRILGPEPVKRFFKWLDNKVNDLSKWANCMLC